MECYSVNTVQQCEKSEGLKQGCGTNLWILHTGILCAPLPKIQAIYSRTLLILGPCILSSIVPQSPTNPALRKKYTRVVINEVCDLNCVY